MNKPMHWRSSSHEIAIHIDKVGINKVANTPKCEIFGGGEGAGIFIVYLKYFFKTRVYF